MSKVPELLSHQDLLELISITQEFTTEVGAERILQRLLEKALDLTGSSKGSIILPYEDRETLFIAEAAGDDREWVLSTFGPFSEKRIPVVGSKAGSVFETGVSLLENEVSDHYAGVDKETQDPTRSMVCVPLVAGDERLGVMQVLNKPVGRYDERDRVVLEHCAVGAAIALRNARLIDSLAAHSGLYGNFRSGADVLELMDELDKPARTETLSVLFADMRGFTQLCQSLHSPTAAQERLSEFITAMAEIVIENSGLLNKFLGDGVMALFRDSEHAADAVQCAFAMINRFTEIKNRWNEISNQQLDYLDLGVGIVTDEVILGGIGSERIRDFTAIGTAVNLAAAFEKAARDGRRILVDQRTFNSVRPLLASFEGPEDFVLRKPGQEVGIRYKRYFLSNLQDETRPRVFISHSHHDRQYAEEVLLPALRDEQLTTWYSADDIPKGASWTAEIRHQLSRCNWLVVLVSRAASESRWVSREIDLAISLERFERRIVPILLDSTPPRSVNEYLLPIQAFDTQRGVGVASQVARHIKQGAD